MVTSSKINTEGVGHLGNKLFIIAALLGLADKNKDEVVLPIDNRTNPKTWMHGNAFEHQIKTSDNIKIKNSYSERGYHYTPIQYSPDMEIVGYFQSEKYFEHCKDLIRYYYSPNISIKNNLISKYSEILKQETISIHVRRTDYLNLQNHHPSCSMEYYSKAIELFPAADKFLIFSDDISWCKSRFGGKKFIFVENDATKDIPSIGVWNDLFLMSMCKHNIIANSSFSWWGAWLNRNKSKMVICPESWFGLAYDSWNSNDNRPSEWIKI